MSKLLQRYSPLVFVHVVFVLVLVGQCTAQLNVWQPTGPMQGNPWGYLTIAVDPSNSNVVYTGTYHTPAGYQGILFKSTSAGPPWTILSSGLDGSPLLKILIDPSNSNVVFAVTYHMGSHIYKSTDAGGTWHTIDPENFGVVGSIRISRSNPRVLYAAGDKLYFSQDGGETWISRQLPNGAGADHVAVNPFNPDVILVTVCEYYDEKNCNPRLYRSANGGATWSQPILDLPGDEGFGALEFDPLLPNLVRVCGNGDPPSGLYESQDLGATWNFHMVPGAIYGLEFDPRTPSTVYAVGLYNLAKSIDGGASWTPFTSGIPQFGPGFLEIDFSSDGRFIHAATSTGVFKTQVRSDFPAFAHVSGRVTATDGRPLRRALVSIIDSQGAEKSVVTSSFGYYTIENVQTTVTYRIYVVSKTHRFEDRIVQVEGNLNDVDFMGEPVGN